MQSCILAILSLLLLISCQSKQEIPKDYTVFRYNEHSNITTLDPAFAKAPRNIWPSNQLFNGLVQLNDSLQVQPDIAQSWKISEDGLTYIFTLRNDVFFHENEDVFGNNRTRKVTAQDFVFSFDRLVDTRLASPGAFVFNSVQEWNALDNQTLQIVLKEPFPAFLGLLSMRFCSVVPHEAMTLYGNKFRSNPVGTGPFTFIRWEENLKLVLHKNPNYHEVDENGIALPYLDGVAVTFLLDKQSEFLQYAQGNIDFVSGLDVSYKDEFLDASGALRNKFKATTQLLKSPYLNTEYLGFYLDSKTPEIQSKALRLAINYGFDRKKMIQYLRNGIGIPAHSGFIPLGLPGAGMARGYHYDVPLAQKHLQQYKAETGDQSPEITITTNGNYLDLVEYIQRQLEIIGIKVNIDVMPSSSLRQERSKGTLDIFRSSWIADYPDAENYLGLFYSPNHSPNGPNYTHFYNEEYDALFAKAKTINNPKERAAVYAQLDSIIIDHVPVVPLFYDQAVRFVSKNIDGLGINPINNLILKRVKKVTNN